MVARGRHEGVTRQLWRFGHAKDAGTDLLLREHLAKKLNVGEGPPAIVDSDDCPPLDEARSETLFRLFVIVALSYDGGLLAGGDDACKVYQFAFSASCHRSAERVAG